MRSLAKGLQKFVLMAAVFLLALGCENQIVQLPEPGPSEIPPHVVMTSPADDAVGFSSDQLQNPNPVWALFDLDMVASSVESKFSLQTLCAVTVSPEVGSPSYDPATKTVSLVAQQLEADQHYLARVEAGALSLQGGNLESDVTWQFTTGANSEKGFAPDFNGITGIAGEDVLSATEMVLHWSAAEDVIDQGTPQDKLEYLVYGAAGDACEADDFNQLIFQTTLTSDDACEAPLDTDPATNECAYNVVGLEASEQYCFAVRARDRGCNLDSNVQIASATTKSGGKLYAANLGANNILVFENASSTQANPPRRKITSNQNGLLQPYSMVLSSDPGGKTLYVANFSGNQILAYDWNADGSLLCGNTASAGWGDVPPCRVLETALNGPVGLALINQTLYVTNVFSNVIAAYENVDILDGAVAPTKQFTVFSDPPNAETFSAPFGIAADPGQDILYVVYRNSNNIAAIQGISEKESGTVVPDWKISKSGLSTDHTRINRSAGLLLDTDHDRLYVVNRGEDDGGVDEGILVFDQVSAEEVRGNFNRPPDWVINTPDLHEPTTLAMTAYTTGDPAVETKRLYIVNSANSQVLALDDLDNRLDSCTGDPPRLCPLEPDLVLMGGHTQLDMPLGVAAESGGDGSDTLYVTNRQELLLATLYSIEVFEGLTIPLSDSQVNIKPNRMVAGAIHGPTGLMVDTATEALTLSNFLANSITRIDAINSSDTTENTLPARQVFGPSTGLSGPLGMARIPDDSAERFLVANLYGNNILEFDLSQCAEGESDCAPVWPTEAHPTDLLRLVEDPLLNSPMDIALHPGESGTETDDRFFVSNRDLEALGDQLGSSIVIYQRDTVAGGLEPVGMIQGESTGLISPVGLFVDPVQNELIVANRGEDNVLVFDVRPEVFEVVEDGNCVISEEGVTVCDLSPVRTIVPHTSNTTIAGLNNPNWVFLDSQSDPNRLYVSNQGNWSIQIYHGDAPSGAEIPDQSLAFTTGLSIPTAIFVDPDH